MITIQIPQSIDEKTKKDRNYFAVKITELIKLQKQDAYQKWEPFT